MKVKRYIQGAPIYDWINRWRYWREWRRWLAGKTAGIPHYLKRKVIADYAERFHLTNLVETGTYFGEMVEANRRRFKRIVSIELDDFLYRRAKKRFARCANIEIWHGDSGLLLPKILQTINSGTLFWLDAHYSGGITAHGEKMAPILEEINSILSHPVRGHVILMDDVRLFDGTDGYPLLAEVIDVIHSVGSQWDYEVKDDILRIVPR